jgi:hypothetical protein
VTDWPPAEPTDAAAVADRRDEFVEAVRDHAGGIAYHLALLEGGDYGRVDFDTDGGEWSVKYEAGELEYLRFDQTSGSEVYVVSTKRQPEPGALATALADYPNLVRSFNDHVAAVEEELSGVSTDFPEPASTRDAVAERQRVLGRVEEVCDEIAGQLHRFEGGEYGTYETRIDGQRWELNWDRDGVSYLRIGGSDGVYLVSQYSPPEASDVRRYVPLFPAFVEDYNETVADLTDQLSRVELP